MSNLQLTEFVKRPSVGNTGRATRVRANFFEVQSFPENNIHHYDITITPDVPPVINRKIWKTFEDQDGQGSLNGIKPVYDGRKNVFSARALPLEDDAGMFEVSFGTFTVLKPPLSTLPTWSLLWQLHFCSRSIHYCHCLLSHTRVASCLTTHGVLYFSFLSCYSMVFWNTSFQHRGP